MPVRPAVEEAQSFTRNEEGSSRLKAQRTAPFLLLRTAPRSAAQNMAVDEVLLHFVAAWDKAVLRFYRWSEAAASFGYFQKYKDVERMTTLRPLVRRPTGGGLVAHDADWTYSLAFPPTAEWYGLKATESYQRVHLWVREAFAGAGLSTNLAAERASPVAFPGQCFVGAEQFDVLFNDRKIAGAAQRRTKQGLLIQGSIQPPPGASRANWEEAFLNVARVPWEPLTLLSDFEERVQDLATNKYSQ